MSEPAAASGFDEAIREVLRIVSLSRQDEKPVFDAILERAARLCGAPMAWLVLVDETRTTFTDTAFHGEEVRSWTLGQQHALEPPSLIAQTILDARTANIADLAETDHYKQDLPNTVRLVEEEGLRSRLYVPLLNGEEAIGCILLSRREVRPFTNADALLVETFAAQAVIAIENVRQFRELQTRLEREAATREILSVISQSPDDEQPVFEVILKSASRLCNAPLAFLSMANEERTHVNIRAVLGARPEFTELVENFHEPIEGAKLVAVRPVAEAIPIRIDDITADDLYRSGERWRMVLADIEGVRSLLAVPLVSGGQGIGAIVLYRREVAPFTDDDLALVQGFAAQAVIAVQNVRQFRELQTRLEREAATREILEVISHSRDDDQPVFAILLEKAAALCNAANAGLALVNEERTHLEVTANLRPLRNFVPGVDRYPLSAEMGSTRSARECRIIHRKDLGARLVDAEGDAMRSETVMRLPAEGVRTSLWVPLVRAGVAIGTFGLFRHEVHPFTDDEIALVESFAAQAVIAIENARQFRELQTRLEREAATREILSVISRSRDDEQPVFQAIIDNATRLCKADCSYLMIANQERTEMAVRAQSDASLGFADLSERLPMLLDPEQSQSAQSLLERRTIQIDDAREDPIYRAGHPHRVFAVDVEGVRSMLTVPLLMAGEGVGVIFLYRRERRPFSDDEIALVESFAAQVVIALESVRQFRPLEKLNAELGDRVTEQVGEIERMGRLKRFLSPAVADAVVSSGDENILSSHRALIGILFCDIRGFTAFCETAEPEETIEFLQTYHEEMGKLINAHGAGVDHRWGDGIMVIFNDPFPCEDPAGDALRLALAMREKMAEICQRWKRLGHRLGFGVGVSLGYATVGMVGSEGRFDYTANGSAVNMAARLCDHAEDGEILVSPRAYTAVEDDYEARSVGEMTFKGIRQPTEVFRVVGPRADA